MCSSAIALTDKIKKDVDSGWSQEIKVSKANQEVELIIFNTKITIPRRVYFHYAKLTLARRDDLGLAL
ncbi:hypothetical protein EGK14_02075 [Erwinia sp. 198]|nr:hypothetical protein EGK14_02075 [Erwinia sp. 198]